jgi:hypothetical protein
LAHCIDNLSKNIFDEQDQPYLKEIARVALNQSKTAKILSHIGVYILPVTSHPLILGSDYLMKNNVVLDFSKMTCNLNSANVQTQRCSNRFCH